MAGTTIVSITAVKQKACVKMISVSATVKAMAIEFYDIKLKKKVNIEEAKVTKVTFNAKGGQLRYGLRATTDDDRKLTKFVSKATWDELKVKEEK